MVKALFVVAFFAAVLAVYAVAYYLAWRRVQELIRSRFGDEL